MVSMHMKLYRLKIKLNDIPEEHDVNHPVVNTKQKSINYAF